jgi:hypothetical protein
MHLNKDMVFIVTTACTYFVTQYFPMLFLTMFTRTFGYETHIPKSALLSKLFIVHATEMGYRADEIHVCKSYRIFWEVGQFAATYKYYSRSTR